MPIDALSPGEAAAVAAVRERAGPCAAQFDDAMMWRFLMYKADHSRGMFDIAKSAEMVQSSARNRATHSLDTITTEFIPPAIMAMYECSYLAGRSRDGSIIFVERPGICNFARMLGTFEEESLIRLHLCVMETGRRLYNRAQGGRAPGVLVIMDLEGISLSNLCKKCYSYISKCAELDRTTYPEHVTQVFIINAPTLFTGVWKLVKPFLDPRTAGKVQILSSSKWREVVEQHIDFANLPPFLGGTGPPLTPAFGSGNPTSPCRIALKPGASLSSPVTSAHTPVALPSPSSSPTFGSGTAPAGSASYASPSSYGMMAGGSSPSAPGYGPRA